MVQGSPIMRASEHVRISSQRTQDFLPGRARRRGAAMMTNVDNVSTERGCGLVLPATSSQIPPPPGDQAAMPPALGWPSRPE